MKKITAALLVLVLALALFPKTVFAAEKVEKETPSGIAYADIGARIDEYVKEYEQGLASCVISVFDSDGLIYNGYYGYADFENNIKADADTVYEWASTSKIMAWVSVMQQWERGNIDLEADIRDYLPEGFFTKLQYPEEKITMLNLMSHTAGFQDSFYEDQQTGPDGIFDTLENALRYCECYQAYHVGEYTSYSNWGCALAAYIVERTSGTDYVTYVHENIFKPLGMEHTAVDPLQRDNEWVKNKRSELKCYGRYANPKDNEDYGEARAYVQLYPAGSVNGTIGDLAKLGQALVANDCPLFEKNSTRDEMFKTVTYYGDTDTEKNCHGLWAIQHKIMTLSHDGNSNCTTTIEFDPVSGLGVAIMSNEPGETKFCSGIPVLLYGSLLDREEYKNAGRIPMDEDISGTYYFTRTIAEGAGKIFKYAMFLPLSRDAAGNYSCSILGFKISDFEYFNLGNHTYLSVDNGREMFVYINNGIYEPGYFDLVKSEVGMLPTLLLYAIIAFGVLCIIELLIKAVIVIVRKVKKVGKKYTHADLMILSGQSIYGMSGVIVALFVMAIGQQGHAFTVISSALAAVLAVASLALSGGLVYVSFKEKGKVITMIRQLLWAGLLAGYMIFIIGMQFYCFWKV